MRIRLSLSVCAALLVTASFGFPQRVFAQGGNKPDPQLRGIVSGSVSLTTPPQPINNGAIDNRFNPNLNTLQPYNVVTNSNLQPSDKTGDIVHRFWHEQSQINHGGMDQFVTWSDNPGLVMSYFDATNLPEGKLAQQYTMDDNFFPAAFGGSFLNHQIPDRRGGPRLSKCPGKHAGNTRCQWTTLAELHHRQNRP